MSGAESSQPARHSAPRSGSGADAGTHSFSQVIRTIGRGPSLSRTLSEDEANQAMAAILRGDAEPAQLGAFLVVLRYRKETPEELAGFVQASRGMMARPASAGAALDWPSYADRHKQLPYFVLAAKLLSENGVRVLMHGIAGDGPATTPKALSALGIEPSGSPDDAAHRLDRENFAYLPLDRFCPQLMPLFDLRPVLGLRSPANTFARMLNPFAAPVQLQGVFHPNYLPTHQATASLLGQPVMAAFKGGGGEIQRNPEKPCHVVTLVKGEAGTEEWPATSAATRHRWRDEPLNPARLKAVWRGDDDAAAPVAAVVGTVAIALRMLGLATSIPAAGSSAKEMWQHRRKTLP